jgi:hypothetical protein
VSLLLALALVSSQTQLWSCEDYLAEAEEPAAGCKWEGGRLSEEEVRARIEQARQFKSIAEKLAIAERLLCPEGVIDWTAAGPTCE